MSFALPPVKAKPESGSQIEKDVGTFGVPDLMKEGFAGTKTVFDQQHPIAHAVLNGPANKHEMNMAVLRNTQGLHAPMRIAMEMNSAKKIGRLPFLPSSNIMMDVLTGKDIEMGPQDIFNLSDNYEYFGQPHAVVEKSLGIL